jgi:hypothetical protein
MGRFTKSGSLVLYTKPSKLMSAASVLKPLNHNYYSFQNVGANGDKLFCYVYCKGSETELNIGSLRGPLSGIYDLYINGLLDSAGYDEYLAAPGNTYTRIILSRPIHRAQNEIEFRVNGRNVLSAGYNIAIMGVSIQ